VNAKRRWPFPWWLRYLTPLGAVVLTGHLFLLLVLLAVLLLLWLRGAGT
jgi:hypothetical protein